jgi:DNA-binding FadR family transcriptional regulator
LDRPFRTRIPNPRRTSAELVFSTLRDEILRGKSGSRLPSERALCDRFGVARTTLRSALGQLEGAKLVTPRQGSGYYVLPIPDEGGPELLATLIGFRIDDDLRWETMADLLLVRRQLMRAALIRLRGSPSSERFRYFDLALAALRQAVERAQGPAKIAAADVDVARELVSLTKSLVLRLCMNPVAHAICMMPDLCEAIYSRPERCVEGWERLRAWLLHGSPGGPDFALQELERADMRTLKAFRRTQRARGPRVPAEKKPEEKKRSR